MGSHVGMVLLDGDRGGGQEGSGGGLVEGRSWKPWGGADGGVAGSGGGQEGKGGGCLLLCEGEGGADDVRAG